MVRDTGKSANVKTIFGEEMSVKEAATPSYKSFTGIGPVGIIDANINILKKSKEGRERLADLKRNAIKAIIIGAVAAFGAYVLYNRYRNKAVQSKTIGFFKVVYNKINNASSKVSIYQLDDNRMIFSKDFSTEEAAAFYTGIDNTSKIRAIVEPQLIEQPQPQIQPANKQLY